MDTQDHVQMLARRAEGALRRDLGREVALSEPALVARRDRSVVVRCAARGLPGVDSVVLKQQVRDDQRGFTEWAGLRFLTDLAIAAGAAPRFYAGLVEERLVVMEDLGSSRNLADLLECGEAESVVGFLRGLAGAMARLLAATAVDEPAYDRLRTALPGAAGLGRRQEALRWLASLERAEHWADTLGLVRPPGFAPTCARIAAVYAEPGPYLAFSHGDPAPSNNQRHGQGVALIDFEYAGYRHALYDLAAWATLCPLPQAWMAVLERAFRRAALAGPLGSVLSDAAGYREARATMCAYRALAILTWIPPEALRHDRPWAEGWTQREALISTALRLHQASRGVASLGPVAAFGRRLARALRARWPDLGEGRPHWPAASALP